MSALGGTHSAALTPTSMDSAAVADRAGPDRRIMTVLATFELDHVQHGVDTGANPTRASEYVSNRPTVLGSGGFRCGCPGGSRP